MRLSIPALGQFEHVASMLTVGAVYEFFARIIASLYFGYMSVFIRVELPLLVCQFLGIRLRAPAGAPLVDEGAKHDEPISGTEIVPGIEQFASTSHPLLRQVSPALEDRCSENEGLCVSPHEQHRDEIRESHADEGDVLAPRESARSNADITASCSRAACATDLSLVESVKGLHGLKIAIASHFASGHNSLPNSFRRGYVVDLNQHWISVHAIFDKSESSVSLIVFDTLEVNYQQYHEVGLLRSSSAEASASAPNLPREDDVLDVATLCAMTGIQYNISFLAPICDMRRLTWEEEELIRTEKKSSPGTSSTVYYDNNGNPFRKIIVQPILQAEQDGTCKSRALAVLGWLLKLDEKALAWHVNSTRELFHAELRASRGAVSRNVFNQSEKPLEEGIDEDGAIFGSLMSTGRRDKFGRDAHMKVCHAATLRHNQNVEAICQQALPGTCLENVESEDALLPSISQEVALRLKREAEMDRIREVMKTPARGISMPQNLDCSSIVAERAAQADIQQRWRALEDHDARWHFLEETCFFGHNLGFRKIPKKYPRDEILVKDVCAQDAVQPFSGGAEDSSRGFGDTKYIRKYRVSSASGNFITHEADPMFHKPLENVLGFLCGSGEEEKVAVPFYVLPFPGHFEGLSLDSYAKGTNLTLDLEGDPDERRRQRVSDYILPSGNNFLNDPISYNEVIANVSLPVKITV